MALPKRADSEGSPELFSLPAIDHALVSDPIFAKHTENGPQNILPYPDNSLEVARRRFMLIFVDQFPLARKAWEAGGLVQDKENHNIIEHQVVSAILGGVLAQEIGLQPEAVRQIQLALLVHDADKIKERDQLVGASRKKGQSRRIHIQNALSIHQELLAGIGIEDDIIHLSEAVVPKDHTRPAGDDRERVIHFIDAIMDGSIPQSPQERMKKAANTSGSRRGGTANMRDKFHAQELGLPPESSYRQVQIELAGREAEQFCEVLNANGIAVFPDRLPLFLQEQFDALVAAIPTPW